MIKRLIIAAILLAVVVGGIVGFNTFRDRAIQQYFASMPVPSVTVSTVKVEPSTWNPGIEAIGTVAASRGVDLTVETLGVVKEIFFDSNQRVAEDEILVQLDDSVQRADLEVARTQSSLDQLALTRAIELQQRGVGSTATLDAARAAAETSASQVQKLQAVLDQKQLRAPYKGTMGIPRIELGQFVQPGTVVATLQDLDTMRADFSVPEQQLSLLQIGQPVIFGVNADNMPFKGSIKGIEPKVDPSSRLVAIRAEISNPEGKLSPGQFVQVRVELPEENDVLAVPETAVVTSLYGDFIFVVKSAAAKQQPAADAATAQQNPSESAAAKTEEPALTVSQVFVKIGRRSNGKIEITEGVSPGDEVVTAGQNRLSNNSPVVINNSVTPTNSGAEAAAR
ncbi:efflux RND transporter periplasmic adaptor subunit [Arvimicrobium flavum]|uniref:efflux RND transporter periplasmic adaptor subunit n=1 Tax=Arvimicrobium flavum TaxID=3393320 RepID=UPI00237A5BB0|nr:efflux RND transporter periplasmic adaptor subunit [Mesorhizobium shangrilense]